MGNNKNTNQVNNTKSNFGKMGWFMICYIAVCLFLAGFMVGDGFNILLPSFAEKGLDLSVLLKYVTIGQMIALVYGMFTILIIRKIGPRIFSTISIVVIGLVGIFWGRSQDPTQWAICYVIIQCCVQMVTANTSMTLAANWFPTRKGLALGWATMGSNIGSALSVYLWTFIFSKFGGMEKGMLVVGIVIIIFGVVTHFIFRDAPEQMGLTPDNIPMTKEELEASRIEFEKKEPIKLGYILKQRNFYIDAILFGVMGMSCAGLVSQLVVGMEQMGVEKERATFLFFIAGLLAMVMSYLFGWLDMKIGTKWATFWLGICFGAGAAALVLIPVADLFVYPAVLLIAGGIGGYVNLMPSLCASIFGRKLFVQAYGIASLITGLIRSVIFTIMAWSLEKYGDYVFSYKLMIALAIVSSLMALLLDEKKFAIYNGEEA